MARSGPPRGRREASPARRSRAPLPTRTAATAAARRRRTTLTARAAVLAVALASVALALALPFKIWLGQRGQIASLQVQTKAQEQRVAALKHQQELWQDPAYVEQQARLRLHYLMPGQKAYLVLGAPTTGKTTAKQGSSGPVLTGPWYSRLWQSDVLAGK